MEAIEDEANPDEEEGYNLGTFLGDEDDSEKPKRRKRKRRRTRRKRGRGHSPRQTRAVQSGVARWPRRRKLRGSRPLAAAAARLWQQEDNV